MLMPQSTIDKLMRPEGSLRTGPIADEPEDYIAAQLGKSWRDSKHADTVCPRFTPCRCGILMASMNSALCDMCQTPAVLYVTRGGDYDTAVTPQRNDRTPLLVVCLLVVICTAIVAASMQGTQLQRGSTTMEAS